MTAYFAFFTAPKKTQFLKFAFVLLNLSYKFKLNKLILSFFHHYAIIMFFLLFICLSICLSVYLSLSFSLSPFLKFAFILLNLNLNKSILLFFHYYAMIIFFLLFICLSFCISISLSIFLFLSFTVLKISIFLT
jgi:hypothetical protein